MRLDYVVCQFGNCWEYDPAMNAWAQKANSDTAFTVGFSIGSKGYAGTGGVNNPNNYFAEYNPASNEWTTKADFGGGMRYYAVGFSIGNKGYIGTGGSNSKDFWEYDPATNTWSQITDIGSGGTTSATAFSIGNRGYVACGEDNTGYSKALWEFYPDIAIAITHSGNICSNQCKGTATATVTLGYPPYTYSWSTIPQQTTATATGLCPGTYSVTVTDSIASTVGSVTINALPDPASIPICMVTVDALSQNNIIIWDKTPYINAIDSFLIYREITSNNYQLIGVVPIDSLSLFVDTVRARYFPNTGNPNAGTYRYKISVKDTCGNTGSLSPYHNTLFVTNNNGNFLWTQLYTIEGDSNPVSAYILLRDNNNTGNWQPVNSVSGYQQSITDPDYATWQTTAKWRIETQWNFTCDPTKSPASFVSSFSNVVAGSSFLNVNHPETISAVFIHPNPAGKIFTLSFYSSLKAELFIRVKNEPGQLIYAETKNNFEGEYTNIINLSKQPAGIYFVEVACGEERIIKKIMLE